MSTDTTSNTDVTSDTKDERQNSNDDSNLHLWCMNCNGNSRDVRDYFGKTAISLCGKSIVPFEGEEDGWDCDMCAVIFYGYRGCPKCGST